MSAFRARLKAKARRTTTYDMVIADDATVEAAEAEFARARRALAVAEAGTDEVRAAAQEAVDKAKDDLRACRDTLTFQALPSHEFEALVAAHEPTKEQQKKGDQWNADTFSPALVAACCVDADMTESEWADELRSERWSLADRNAIFAVALAANVSPRSVTIPKG